MIIIKKITWESYNVIIKISKNILNYLFHRKNSVILRNFSINKYFIYGIKAALELNIKDFKSPQIMKNLSHVSCQHVNHKNKCYGENIYNKVGNEKRLALLDMVKLQGKSLKDSANKLGINYSTAKTILRVYRIENRILKKAPCQARLKKSYDSQNEEESSQFQFVEENSNSNNEKDCVQYVNSASEDNKERRPKDNIFRVISRENASKSSACQSNLTPSYTFLDDKIDKASKINLSLHPNLCHSTSPITVSSIPHDEVPKSTDEFFAQFKQILATLQFCINEVARNEITIKNICSMLGISHVGNISGLFTNPYVINSLRNNQIFPNSKNIQHIPQNQPLLQGLGRNLHGSQINPMRDITNIQNQSNSAAEQQIHKPIPITYSGNNFVTMNTTLLNK